jgi:prepilin-type N-terminal cleavage/methylation domain-containing protein
VLSSASKMKVLLPQVGWLPRPCHSLAWSGFTLAELLIALAILGVIATFTLPKVLQSQQNNQYKTIAKEAAGMLSGSYQAYQVQNIATGATGSSNLTPYMNYVSIQTTGSIDGDAGTPTLACDVNNICLKLHNGAVFRLILSNTFGGTQSTRNIIATVDPDGVFTGNADSLFLLLYFNGRIGTHANRRPGDLTAFGGADSDYGPGSTDPPWFNWN